MVYSSGRSFATVKKSRRCLYWWPVGWFTCVVFMVSEYGDVLFLSEMKLASCLYYSCYTGLLMFTSRD